MAFDDHDSAVVFEQGFGVVSWDMMKNAGKGDANLEDAFALHFNGNGKPWDAERCLDLADLSPPEERFTHYAELSPKLFQKHRRELVKMGGNECGWVRFRNSP